MSTMILAECVKVFPERPVLDAAEWPYTREGLDERIDRWMLRLDALGPATVGAAPETWFGYRKQLLHNGRKP